MSDVCIKVCSTREEAEILQDILEEEEIDSDILTNDGGGNSSPLPSSCGFCLVVAKDDRERAQKIIRSQGGQGYKKPSN